MSEKRRQLFRAWLKKHKLNCTVFGEKTGIGYALASKLASRVYNKVTPQPRTIRQIKAVFPACPLVNDK